MTFAPDAFDDYCHTLQWSAWRPSFIVLHNTAVPNLAQRPDGLTAQSMASLERYYRDEKKWKAGHSPSWNKSAVGVEMLGDYETEPFDSGRGLAVRRNTVAAIATVSAVLGINCWSMRIHREDPLTTHACPGKHVPKMDVIREVQELMVARHTGEHSVAGDQ